MFCLWESRSTDHPAASEHHVQGPELPTWFPAPSHLNGDVKLPGAPHRDINERGKCGPLESSWSDQTAQGSRRHRALGLLRSCVMQEGGASQGPRSSWLALPLPKGTGGLKAAPLTRTLGPPPVPVQAASLSHLAWVTAGACRSRV